MFDTSVTSEISYDTFTSAFVAGIGFVPDWGVKLVVLRHRVAELESN
jgi:succinate dehydrogenase / fumarate reductase cytochrome b subunit